MGLFQEFKEFAVKGNVLDMAVGVIIGGAFGKVVSSLLNDIIMPPLGLLMGGMNFNDLSLTLKAATPASKAVTLNYGAFVTIIIDFVIVASAVFLMVKVINGMKKSQADPVITVLTEKPCTECLLIIPMKAKRCGHCGVEIPA